MKKISPTATHWGNYLVETEGNQVKAIHPYPGDHAASPMGQSLLEITDPNVRIARPAIRKGYLENGSESDGTLRGNEPFVEVDWECALGLAADALERARTNFGNASIFGGSYGWSSAGRFHHAQSQIHRFLNTIGGYVASRDSYSVAAGARIVPHILGMSCDQFVTEAPTPDELIDHADLFVCFGGIAIKNSQVNHGGLGRHHTTLDLEKMGRQGIGFVNISPIQDDMAACLNAEWISIRPQSDAALMLSIAYVLHTENLADLGFLERYTTGYEKFASYLVGSVDENAKTPEWAEQLSGVPAIRIRALAREMATKRTVITASLSLQRAEHGEQPWWLAIVLSAMLGRLGSPNGGLMFGYGSIHGYGFYGRHPLNFRSAALPQGTNAVEEFIPVARVTDMLLKPGQTFQYNGEQASYPDISVLYWAGGNPFHHHQDLNRLRAAWAKPDAIIVNESFWNPVARHADIVFPVASTLERNDFAISSIDTWISPMPAAIPAYAASKSDFEIFSGIARHMGCQAEFDGGLSELQWVELLYEETRANAVAAGVTLPDFETFWRGKQIDLSGQLPRKEFKLEQFRRDPDAYPLGTPSGKIEFYSETIERFGYHDCGGCPMWYDKTEWLGGERANSFPFHLISNQPKGKLHSQLDHASNSRKRKSRGREILTMNSEDALSLEIAVGDIVRVFNDRGACLASVKISDRIRTGVVELPTGAWFDPRRDEPGQNMCVHGNPNVLTPDIPTSQLSQGCAAHSCLVAIEKFSGDLPDVRAFQLPDIR